MRFLSVHSLEEAHEALSERGDEIRILAGGTDVMVQQQHGEIDPAMLLHIERIEALREVDTSDTRIRLGALVTHRKVGRDSELSSSLPALAEASATVGGWQTQEVGTIAGNVANASPAADTVPALLNADCMVHLTSAEGGREVPLDEFIVGRRQTARHDNELISGLSLEPIRPRTGETYLKVGPRSAMEVALVGLAVRVTASEDGATVEDARVSVCSVAPVPYRVSSAEAALIGSSLDDEVLAEAGELLRESAQPIDDARATGTYRQRILAPLLGRATRMAWDRATGGTQ